MNKIISAVVTIIFFVPKLPRHLRKKQFKTFWPHKSIFSCSTKQIWFVLQLKKAL